MGGADRVVVLRAVTPEVTVLSRLAELVGRTQSRNACSDDQHVRELDGLLLGGTH